MFAYYPRKQEDIDLFKTLLREKRELNQKFQDDRSNYDIDLEKYNVLIRKLDKLKVDCEEHKSCVSELDGLVIKLKQDDKTPRGTPKTDEAKPKTDEAKPKTDEAKPKPKRQYAKKEKHPVIHVNNLIND